MDSKKAFVYLDQNIIQYDYEKIINLDIDKDIYFVYSDEHFNEINRKLDEKFFETLRRIKARKLKISLDSNFNITNDAVILDYQDPKKLYDEYQELIENTKHNSNIFLELQPYFMGNTEAVTPEDINKRFSNQMNDIFSQLPTNIIPEEIQKLYQVTISSIGNELEKTLAKAKNEILPIEKMRKKLTQTDLSTINYENGIIIEQIWNMIGKNFPGIEMDQLFGKKTLPFMKVTEMPVFLSIVQCHNMLNILGYWPDKGLTKLSKVYGINSDASHIAHATFCSGIISADDRLCKKAKAIYQYLGLNKSVIQISFNSEGKEI